MMRTRTILISLLAMILFSPGCQGTGQVVNLDVHKPPLASKNIGQGLRILVRPFEDHRPTKEEIGVRTHLGGGLTYFTIWDGKLGKGMAEIFVTLLNNRGFRAKLLSETDSTPATTSETDVILSGRIRELSANAHSRVGSTQLAVNILLELEAHNLSDGSVVRVTVGAGGSDTVVWFETKDLEELVNEVLREVFRQFLQEVRVQENTLRSRT
ncbi:MAG: hypothetical protein D6704_01730 [Nitrospirae bacterium]|nr:MAG: hypothetical protein D6704_01730 [Nitrospirota bacterium]